MAIFSVLLAAVSCTVFKSGAEKSGSEPFISSDSVIAIRNVNDIPIGREGIDYKQTVIVSDGKINDIFAFGEREIPQTAAVIDGDGEYLLPGCQLSFR